jgi:hypothetical protein
MRRGKRAIAAGVTTAFVVGLLGACTPPEPQASQRPTVTRTPVFASDDEALAAATKAYAAYLEMSDTIAHDGGANPERIKPFASGKALKLAMRSAEQYREASAHSVGATTFSRARLQNLVDIPPGGLLISFYVCEDVSQVEVIDEGGVSLVSSNRPPEASLVITVVRDDRGKLVMSEESPWTGGGVCD